MPRKKDQIDGLTKKDREYLESKGIKNLTDLKSKLNNPSDKSNILKKQLEDLHFQLQPRYSAIHSTADIYNQLKAEMTEDIRKNPVVKKQSVKDSVPVKSMVKSIPKPDYYEEQYPDEYPIFRDAPDEYADEYDYQSDYDDEPYIQSVSHFNNPKPQRPSYEDVRPTPMREMYQSDNIQELLKRPQLTTTQEVARMTGHTFADNIPSYMMDAGGVVAGLATENAPLAMASASRFGSRVISDLGEGASKGLQKGVSNFIERQFDSSEESEKPMLLADGRMYNNSKSINQKEPGVINYVGQEFMQDIVSNTSSFLLTTIPVNFGLINFPVISATASNFTYYRVNKCKFIYKPTSGDGSSNTLFRLGTIQMATNNPIESAPTTKLQMAQYADSIVGRPVQEVSIEVSPSPYWYNIRTTTTYRPGEDLRLTDIAKLYINVCNMMAGGQVCGELYCELDIDLRQVDYNANLAVGNQNANYYSRLINQTLTFASFLPSTAGGINYGGDPQTFSNITGMTFPTGASMAWPAVYQNGSVFRVMYCYGWASVGGNSANGPTFTVGSNSTFLSDGKNTQMRFASGNVFYAVCTIKITGLPDAIKGHLWFDTNGNPVPTLPTTVGYLYIQQLPSSFAVV
jgi:hypothetical protein